MAKYITDKQVNYSQGTGISYTEMLLGLEMSASQELDKNFLHGPMGDEVIE